MQNFYNDLQIARKKIYEKINKQQEKEIMKNQITEDVLKKICIEIEDKASAKIKELLDIIRKER